MADGMHQVRFSKSHASIDKERIVNLTRGFGHSQGCCVGQVVVGTYHEGIKDYKFKQETGK